MEQQNPKPAFDQWCVVELMGHQRIAGRVTEETLFGTALMRVDVPETSKGAGFTKFYGSTAIYCVTPVDEAIARARHLIDAYRRACIKARVDPVTGPATTYEHARATAEARKAAAFAQGGWWWLVDWGDPGYCPSLLEYAALLHILYDAYWMRINMAEYDDPPLVPLRERLAALGLDNPLDAIAQPEG